MKKSAHLLLFATAMVLVACGFHLRGHGGPVTLAFNSVYLNAANETPFVTELRSALEANKIEVMPTSENAALTLEIISEMNSKQILSLSSAGKVLEYQLGFRVTLRAYDQQRNTWLPQEEIILMRSFAYDDAQLLAKEQEEALLYRDMRSDAVQQALRRLSRAKPHNERGEIISPDSIQPASGVSEAGETKSGSPQR